MDKVLINDYVNAHKERSKIVYSKIIDDLVNNKEKITAKWNLNRDDPTLFRPQQTVFVRKHIRQHNQINLINTPQYIQ